MTLLQDSALRAQLSSAQTRPELQKESVQKAIGARELKRARDFLSHIVSRRVRSIEERASWAICTILYNVTQPNQAYALCMVVFANLLFLFEKLIEFFNLFLNLETFSILSLESPRGKSSNRNNLYYPIQNWKEWTQNSNKSNKD